MYMLIRMPLACLLILSYAFGCYCVKKSLKTGPSRVFSAMAVAAIVHTLAAVVTEYTVHHRDAVSERFNYVWHVIFLLSLSCVCVLLYAYLILYIEYERGKRLKYAKRALAAVAFVSMLGQIVLPIEYIDTPYGSYSLGMKAYSLYLLVIYIVVMMAVTIFRYRDEVGSKKAGVLLASEAIFILTSVIQMVSPYILLTSLAVTLVVLGIMVNMEDVHMYLSFKTGLYNELGLRESMQELLFSRKKFQAAVYVFTGSEMEREAAIRSVQQKSQKKMICGTVADNVLVMLPVKTLAGITGLPAEDTGVEGEDSTLNYVASLMEFSNEMTVEDIFREIRNFKARVEADVLERDELTGLLRRSAFSKQVEWLIAREQDFTFLMLDVDNFKMINDSYGHGVGDKVLQYIAASLQNTLRTTDLICRMGGDEFAAVLTGVSDPEKVLEISDRIRKGIVEMDMLAHVGERTTVSIGIQICRPQEGAVTFQEVYAEADAALYHAKYNGKDQAFFSDEHRIPPI